MDDTELVPEVQVQTIEVADDSPEALEEYYSDYEERVRIWFASVGWTTGERNEHNDSPEALKEYYSDYEERVRIWFASVGCTTGK